MTCITLQVKFAPRAPPRRVKKEEVKSYVSFGFIHITWCNVIALLLLYLIINVVLLFCFCSEVVEDTDANVAKDLLRRLNVCVICF